MTRSSIIAEDIYFEASEAGLIGSGKKIPRNFIAQQLWNRKRYDISNHTLTSVLIIMSKDIASKITS